MPYDTALGPRPPESAPTGSTSPFASRRAIICAAVGLDRPERAASRLRVSVPCPRSREKAARSFIAPRHTGVPVSVFVAMLHASPRWNPPPVLSGKIPKRKGPTRTDAGGAAAVGVPTGWLPVGRGRPGPAASHRDRTAAD